MDKESIRTSSLQRQRVPYTALCIIKEKKIQESSDVNQRIGYLIYKREAKQKSIKSNCVQYN